MPSSDWRRLRQQRAGRLARVKGWRDGWQTAAEDLRNLRARLKRRKKDGPHGP